MKNNKILFIGDSLLAWNPLKIKDLENFAVAGYTSTNILFQLKRINFDNYNKNDILVLLFGVNDLLNSFNFDNLYENYNIIIPYLKNKFKNIIFILLLPTDSETLNEKIKIVNNFLKRFDMNCLDIYNLLINNKGLIDNKFTTDGIHLSNLGYDILNENLKHQIEQIF